MATARVAYFCRAAARLNPSIQVRSIAERGSGRSDSYEMRLRRPDGTDVWVILRVAPILDHDGVFKGSVATVTDITGRVEAEKVLEESERRFRALLVARLGRDHDQPPG